MHNYRANYINYRNSRIWIRCKYLSKTNIFNYFSSIKNLCWDSRIFIIKFKGMAMVMIPSISFLTLLHPESAEMQQYIAYLELFSGLGFAFGPVLGSIIYSFVGYQHVFSVIGLILFINIWIILHYLPNNEDLR